MLNLLIQYKFVCMKKLYFKMHSETTLLCCVQPGFLNLRVKLLLLLMLFLGKFSDNKKFLIGQNLLGGVVLFPMSQRHWCGHSCLCECHTRLWVASLLTAIDRVLSWTVSVRPL